MRATTTHRRRRRAKRSAGLGAIAELVDAAFHADPSGNGVIVRVIDAPDGNVDELEIGLKPLDGEHPFRAQRLHRATRVVGDRRRRHGPRPPPRCARPPPTPMTTTCLCDRSGAMASILRTDGSPPTVVSAAAAGIVADTLRRVVGVPTTPPEGTSRTLLTMAWLDRIVAASVSAPGITTWATVALLTRPPQDRRCRGASW